MYSPALGVLAAAACVVGFWIVLAFNLLVRDRNLRKEAWSGIDVQLKRRHTLIPQLVEVVKGYGNYEREVLENVTRERSRVEAADTMKDRQAGENALTDQLKSLLAVVEAYPDLKAARTFLDLQRSLCEIEEQIQMARRYFNGATRNYNVHVESFPGLLVARLFRFEPAEFFQIETATERVAPKVEMA